jgi:hypothetical protein
MTATLKVKVIRKPTIKVKVLPKFPASVSASDPIILSNVGGNYAFSFNMATVVAAVINLFQPIENIDQPIIAGATANVNVNSNTVRVNKTVGGAITLTLPLAASKKSAVLIADWKGDAGTNNITILTTGAETIQGLASWTIGSDNGSIFLRPIPGVGYAI